MKSKISARIIADSISPQGHRITSYILTYPRFIHSEMMTHRMFSRNAASSRAIPFEKMLKMVEEDPFIPIAWQKDHKGMQGTEYIEDQHIIDFKKGVWLKTREEVINRAKELNSNLVKSTSIYDQEILEETGVTKQLCNRLLEPFLWYTNLVTATEFDNFFELRCPKYRILGTNTDVTSVDVYKSKKDAIKDYPATKNLSELEWIKLSESGAEIHIQALAEAMWDARNESTPKQLRASEWHIPFGDKMDVNTKSKILLKEYNNIISKYDNFDSNTLPTIDLKDLIDPIKIKIATARAARLSYMTFDGEIDYEKDIKLHDMLLKSKHMSPFEHCAKVPTDLEYYSAIKGEVPTSKDNWGILNYEYYPLLESDEAVEYMNHPKGKNPKNKNRYGWFNNFHGFIPYRYLIEEK